MNKYVITAWMHDIKFLFNHKETKKESKKKKNGEQKRFINDKTDG